MNHSALCRKLRRGAASEVGDLVVGIAQHPDPVPCPSCAVGEWDMCRNGRYTERGIKERRGFGSDVYHVDTLADLRIKPDVLMDCSGAPSVIRDVLGNTAASGIACLVGVTESGHDFAVDVGALNQTMVLDKNNLFGTVNANKMQYQMAGEAFRHADRRWLDMMITRREPAEHWTRSLERRPDDIKVIVEFS